MAKFPFTVCLLSYIAKVTADLYSSSADLVVAL